MTRRGRARFHSPGVRAIHRYLLPSETVIDLTFPDGTTGRIFARTTAANGNVVDFSWWSGPSPVQVMTPGGTTTIPATEHGGAR